MQFFKNIWQYLKGREGKALEQAKRILRIYDVTADLLQQAEAAGYKIRIDRKLKGKGILGQFKLRPREITLQPGRPADDTALTLAHELRHFQQYRAMGYVNVTEHPDRYFNDARTALIFIRTIEADAFAFEFFVHEKLKTIGEALKMVETETRAVLQERGLQGLDPAAHDEVQRRLNQKQDSRFLFSPEKDIAQMQIFFKAAIKHLHSYGKDALVNHAFLKTQTPPPAPRDDMKISFPRLRRILHVGVPDKGFDYFSGLTDRDFGAMVMEHVPSEQRRAIRLMNLFNAASEKGMTEAEKNEKTDEIKKQLVRVKDAVKKRDAEGSRAASA